MGAFLFCFWPREASVLWGGLLRTLRHYLSLLYDKGTLIHQRKKIGKKIYKHNSQRNRNGQKAYLDGSQGNANETIMSCHFYLSDWQRLFKVSVLAHPYCNTLRVGVHIHTASLKGRLSIGVKRLDFFFSKTLVLAITFLGFSSKGIIRHAHKIMDTVLISVLFLIFILFTDYNA